MFPQKMLTPAYTVQGFAYAGPCYDTTLTWDVTGGFKSCSSVGVELSNWPMTLGQLFSDSSRKKGGSLPVLAVLEDPEPTKHEKVLHFCGGSEQLGCLGTFVPGPSWFCSELWSRRIQAAKLLNLQTLLRGDGVACLKELPTGSVTHIPTGHPLKIHLATLRRGYTFHVASVRLS